MEHLGQGRRRRLTAIDAVRVRAAGRHDLAALIRFAREVLPEHYTPILGAAAAEAQVATWWTDERHEAAMRDGRLLVAEHDGELVGVVQAGMFDGDWVVWKLYLRPSARGAGLGRQLIEAVVATLPAGTTQLVLEHFAGNTAAARFYEREGFVVDRVERHPGDDRRHDTVWRVKNL